MSWPEWCWCPLAGAHAIASGGGTLPRNKALDVGRLGALAAWRCTQTIYRFDPTLLAALVETPVTGDIPIEVLKLIPEWCVYIELGEELGVWAHLEHDVGTGRAELRLLLDQGEDWDALLPIPIHLGADLSAGLGGMLDEAMAQSALQGDSITASILGQRRSQTLTADTSSLGGMVSAILYLCADDADTYRRAKPPRFVRKKKGDRVLLPTPKRSEVLDVGTRIGAALRDAQGAQARYEGDPTGKTVRPHVRRAHWHTYWTGAGRKVPKLRWVSPILVGGTPETATVRPVKGVG